MNTTILNQTYINTANTIASISELINTKQTENILSKKENKIQKVKKQLYKLQTHTLIHILNHTNHPILHEIIYTIIYQKNIKLAYFIVNKFNLSPTQKEDAIQECFVKLFSKIKEFNPTKSKFSTFATTIFKNTIIDFLRTYSKNQSQDEKISPENPSPITPYEELTSNDITTSFLTQETIYTILSHLKNFSQLEKKCFILKFFKNLSIQEITQKLNISSQSYTKKLIYDTRKKLLEKIKL